MTGAIGSIKRDFDGVGEILLIDKPVDWTSFDVVNRVRRLLHIEKAGHAGTLDPKATGLLILCTGKQTKNLSQFVGLEKEYVGTFELGVRTPSFDAETEVTERRDYSSVTFEAMEVVSRSFIGKQQQYPPMYSATKYHGQPLYKYARRGETVERIAKEIEISEFEIGSFTPPLVDFRVVCSKGTYIRSLVDDLGANLGCGASLLTLRRTRIGPFRVEESLTIADLDLLKEELSLQQCYDNETSLSA